MTIMGHNDPKVVVPKLVNAENIVKPRICWMKIDIKKSLEMRLI